MNYCNLTFRKAFCILAFCMVFFLCSSPSMALIEVSFGNSPLMSHEAESFPLGVDKVADLSSRLGYSIGPPFGGGLYTFEYECKDTNEFQKALNLFAAIRTRSKNGGNLVDQALALEVLANAGEVSAIPYLKQLLEYKWSATRLRVLRSLIKLYEKDKTVLKDITIMLEDDNPQVKKEASRFILLMQQSNSNPTSENVIREAAARQLNKDPNELNDEDFARITELCVAETKLLELRGEMVEIHKKAELSDIKLLKKFINLEKLDLSCLTYPQKNIPKWMKLLAKIGVIDLSKRSLLDLEPLRKLTKLKELNLNTTKIQSLKPLSKLTNLEVLELYMVEISDISPIRNLTNLREIQLTGNPINDFQPLMGLKNLEILSLYGTEITDLNVIKDLTNMRELELIMTDVSNLEPLRGMKKLQKLDLFETKVSDLEPISDLVELQYIRLNNAPLSNIEPLKNLPNLEHLDISGTQVSDLEPLKQLKKLKSMYILQCINITDEQIEDLKRAFPDVLINVIYQ